MLGVICALGLLLACSGPPPKDKGAEAQAAKAPPATAQCRTMESLAFIPPGFHPVSAQWAPGSKISDLVCYTKTNTNEIQVVQWLDFPLPAGYHILYGDSTGVDVTFRGCKSWTVWNNQYTCTESWPRYRLRKNPE